MLTQEGLAVQRVYILPGWITKNLGSLVGEMLINGIYRQIYVSQYGLESKRHMPGYFSVNDKWYRLPYTGGWQTI